MSREPNEFDGNARLRRQKKQDYIHNKFGKGYTPIQAKFDLAQETGKNFGLMGSEEHNDGDGHPITELEMMLQPSDQYQFQSRSSKTMEENSPGTDGSYERINYDKAFEEMKHGLEQQNFLGSPGQPQLLSEDNSPEVSEDAYDRFLNKELNLKYMESEGHDPSSEGQNHPDFGFPDNDTSDLRNDMADEYTSHEGIAIPNPTVQSKRDTMIADSSEKQSKHYKDHQGSSSGNTLTKAITHHKSAESSSSDKSPCIPASTNVKTYVLNKSRKLISNLNKSEKG